MAGGIDPTGSNKKPYHAQYKDTPGFHKMWNKLFRKEVTKEESQQMTDGYMKIMENFMNKLAQKAIQKLKEMKKLIESDYQDDGK